MLVSQHTMEQTISKMLTELNFPDMKYEITKEFDRWVIRLTQTQDVELLLELMWDNGGWVGCVLDHKGMSHKTKSLIMDTLMKHLELD
jgi:hypothetical protein